MTKMREDKFAGNQLGCEVAGIPTQAEATALCKVIHRATKAQEFVRYKADAPGVLVLHQLFGRGTGEVQCTFTGDASASVLGHTAGAQLKLAKALHVYAAHAKPGITAVRTNRTAAQFGPQFATATAMPVAMVQRGLHIAVQPVEFPLLGVEQVGAVAAVAAQQVYQAHRSRGLVVRQVPFEAAAISFKSVQHTCEDFHGGAAQDLLGAVAVPQVEGEGFISGVRAAGDGVHARGMAWWQVLQDACVEPGACPQPMLVAHVAAAEVYTGLDAVVAVPPDIGAHEALIGATVGRLAQVVVEGDVRGDPRAVVEQVGIGQTQRGVNDHVIDAAGDVHVGGVAALQVVVADPPRQDLCGGGLHIPVVGDVIVVATSIARHHLQVQRHR